jgi:multicomponent Na+:H+ antiporter subunit D
MSLLVVLPLLLPLGTAILGIVVRRPRSAHRAIAVGGALALLVASIALLADVWANGVRVVQAGDWPAPFGITLVADMLSAIMVTLAAITGLAAVVYSTGSIGPDRERLGYYPLTHLLLLGVCGAFLTGDLFNLYVWFEVLLIASFVLLALGGGRPQMEGALKYVVLNLVASALFLAGIGLLYGVAGTLNMADLAVKLREGGDQGYLTAIAMLFMVAFGIKAAMFPLFFWLPASYHTAPAAVAAIFAGLLTKVGVYALIRVFTLIFTGDIGHTHTIILWGSVATMVVGVLGAVSHNDIKRILSFHIISQIGYMTLGLALATPFALAASVFYIAHHIIVKANLFLIGGMIRRTGGSYHLASIGGLYRSKPFLAVLFFIPAFSLAGIPPLSGFMAKFTLVRAAFESHEYVAGGVALGVGLLTLLSMNKIWVEAFLKPAPGEAIESPQPLGLALILPAVALAALTLTIGLAAEPFFRAANEAGAQLMEPNAYIQAVLGARQ